MQTALWEIVKSVLPNIRLLPSGRRLAQKLNAREGNHSSGSATPSETPSNAATPRQTYAAPFIDRNVGMGEIPPVPHDNAIGVAWQDPGNMDRRRQMGQDAHRGAGQYHPRYGQQPHHGLPGMRTLSFF
jgi:hypothetical protein